MINGENANECDKVNWVGHIRARKLAPLLLARERDYAVSLTPAESLKFQLERFNRLWKERLRLRPFFSELARRNDLPNSFSSWEEFVERVPVTTKSEIKQFHQKMIGTAKKPDFWRMTGGSTAEPLRIPAWKSEDREVMPNMWQGRSWYGIGPQDRLFTIWGHSHLLGQGLTGQINGFIRRAKDRLLGYHRFSAYDLSETSMRRAAEEMLRFRPSYVIGYGVALDTFARFNADFAAKLRELPIKAVVGTAERFPFADSGEVIADVFGCTVAMEYGAVETGVMAHTCPQGGYRTFWQHYFLDADGDGSLNVTCLYDRCLPLVRYAIEDRIRFAVEEESRLGLRRFQEVIGRCNDYVQLADGTRVHSEAFSHCVRDIPQISKYQVVQNGDEVAIHLVLNQSLAEDQISRIHAKLSKVHPRLEGIAIEERTALTQTVAGKTPMVVRSEVKDDV